MSEERYYPACDGGAGGGSGVVDIYFFSSEVRGESLQLGIRDEAKGQWEGPGVLTGVGKTRDEAKGQCGRDRVC